MTQFAAKKQFMTNANSKEVSSKKASKIKSLIKALDTIIASAENMEESLERKLDKVHPKYLQCARNLIHYRVFRSYDLNNLQKRLGNMGLSRLARNQSHVLHSLYLNRAILSSFLDVQKGYHVKGISHKKADRILKRNVIDLMGPGSKGRRTRIMVTLPSEAAHDYELVRNMIARGMNCARINCAHDDKEAWLKMIAHVHRASDELKKTCRIAMDLAGPKIRTGTIAVGPQILKLKPQKNERGEIVKPLQILLSDQEVSSCDMPVVPINLKDCKAIELGDVYVFRDARKKKRKIEIIKRKGNGFIALCFKTTYLETGIILKKKRDHSKRVIKIDHIAPLEMSILLRKGDLLRIDLKEVVGQAAQYDVEGKLITLAHISCTAPKVFQDTAVGEPVLFDDGKIGGFIKSIQEDYVEIEINHAEIAGSWLKADKGINLPLSHIRIRGLTPKDIIDLDFVAKHADIVNMSFVNGTEDVEQLLNELEKRKVTNKLGVVLKIETQRGFNNLTEILITAMQNYPIGVMIARGDLAVECGWKNIGRIQMEILSVCLAAHVTDIWATQVLENLAKRGLPSRSEITDVVEAQQADCVMLNKGPYILESIKLLDSILRNMEPYREKNIVYSPALSKAIE